MPGEKVEVEPNEDPWLIHQEGDPDPDQPWYTPARYIARKLVKDDKRLLYKRDILCNKIADELPDVGIYARGTKNARNPLDPETIKKALIKVDLEKIT